MQEFATRCSRAPHRHGGIAVEFGLMRLADQRRQDMAALQVEIVAWAVKIRRHGRDIIAAILPAIGLAQLDPGDLGDRIPFGGGLDRDRKSTRLNSSHYCALRMPPPAGKNQT